MKNSAAACAAGALALGAMLFMHGAVPFLAAPTLGQAVWSTGFSQSFLNDSLFSLYAANFGAPRPAPIAFGLSGAWPAAVFMAAGLHPVDAYSAMAALWLSVAFVSAYKLGRSLGVARAFALLGAVLWLSLPIIWAHASYSMLSLGIALLPFYFLCALSLIQGEPRFSRAAAYVAACIVSVFMDGYTFVMFAAGASLLALWLLVDTPAHRRHLARWVLPVHAGALAAACALYLAYLGNFRYEEAPLDSFRAWGLDLAFVAVPTQGVHWIADALGLSVARSEEWLFGDASVWRTTFAAPLLVAALYAGWRMRRSDRLAGVLLVILAGSFYLALGPSLKVHSTKPPGEALGQTMPARYAVAATGSAWLSSSIPGLRRMRAAYRWLALSLLSAWLLLVLLLRAREGRAASAAAAIAGAVALINLPDIPRKWQEDVANREMFLRMEAELVDEMRELLRPGERVAFVPYRNDMLANYVAARLRLVAYNIGGDKNLDEARRHWPPTMREFRMGVADEGFPGHVIMLLARREADAVVLPYIDLLWGAHQWPAPAQFRQPLQPAVRTLKESGFVVLEERSRYAVLRLDADSQRVPAEDLERVVFGRFCMPPLCLRHNGAPLGVSRLAAGRYRLAVHGRAASPGQSWIEVVSAQAGAKARFALEPRREGVLAEGLVTLEFRAEDLKVNVVVGEGDMVQIERFELVPTRLTPKVRQGGG